MKKQLIASFNLYKKLFLKSWKIIVILFIFLALFYIFILKDLPSPTKLGGLSASKSSQIFDRNDKLLYSIYASKNQTFVPLSQIPKSLQQASIAIEDKDSAKHTAIHY